jgi:hypothetical protein
MADKFHITPSGQVRKCSATKRPCPYGGEEAHYPTKEAAEKAFQDKMEEQMKDTPWGKRRAAAKAQWEEAKERGRQFQEQLNQKPLNEKKHTFALMPYRTRISQEPANEDWDNCKSSYDLEDVCKRVEYESRKWQVDGKSIEVTPEMTNHIKSQKYEELKSKLEGIYDSTKKSCDAQDSFGYDSFEMYGESRRRVDGCRDRVNRLLKLHPDHPK